MKAELKVYNDLNSYCRDVYRHNMSLYEGRQKWYKPIQEMLLLINIHSNRNYTTDELLDMVQTAFHNEGIIMFFEKKFNLLSDSPKTKSFSFNRFLDNLEW